MDQETVLGLLRSVGKTGSQREQVQVEQIAKYDCLCVLDQHSDNPFSTSSEANLQAQQHETLADSFPSILQPP